MKFYEYIEGLHETYKKKNLAYGNSAHDSFVKYGPICYITRLSDKLSRYKTLCENKDIDHFDESVKDTINDAVTYCIMFMTDMADADHYESVIHDIFATVAQEDVTDDVHSSRFSSNPDNFIAMLDAVYGDISNNRGDDAIIFSITSLLNDLMICGFTL